MVNYVTEKSYIACVDELERRLAARKPDLDVRHVVIVPDVYTFELEKRLMLGFGGAFDVEITTFNRICSRIVSPETEVIGKQAAIMLLKRICRERAGELKCYSRSALRQGFGGKLYDAINRFRSCGITADDLREAAESDTKIADLALLYSEYEKEIAGKYVDAGGRMKLLRIEAENRGIFKNAHVYVALYDTFTAEAERLVDLIGNIALSATVFTSDRCDLGKISDATVYKFADDVREYKAVAVMIREYIFSGGNPDGIAIVDGRGETAVMRRIFDEYGIPYYADATVTLDKTELGRFVFTLISCVSGVMRQSDVISLAFNRYTGLTIDESSAFADYVRARAVDYKGFYEPFDDETAESSRKKIVALTDGLKDKTDRASSLARALTEILEKIGARETTIEIGKLDLRDYEQVYDKAIDLIRSFGALMYGAADDEDDKISDVLREGFAGTEISLVPNRSGVVTVGGLAAFRGTSVDLGIVVGFNDGVMPSTFRDDGLVADSDADKLEKYRIKIAPKTEEKTELCRDELRHFLKGAKRLILTYTEEDGAKPSYDLIKIMRENGLKPRTFALTDEEKTDPVTLARFLSVSAGAYESVMLNPSMPNAGSVLAASENAAIKIDPVPDEKLSEPVGAGQTTSVSALQTYFRCPRMYFFGYGLKIKKREEGKVNAVDVGLLLHKIAENYVNEGCPDDCESFVKSALPEAVKLFDKYGYAVNERILSRVEKEAIKLAAVIKTQIRIGNFKPIATEKSFGKQDSELKTVTLPCGVGLMGNIDRIDAYGDYARVIDYKTGACDFDYADVYYGKKIQLPVYLRVLIENGYRPAGAFYFPLASSWSDDEYTHRLIGPFNTDEDVLRATDPELVAEEGKSKVVAASTFVMKSGIRSFYGSRRAVTESTLGKIASYAVAVADGAAREIRDGYIEPTPLDDGAIACNRCDFRNACLRKGKTRGEKPVGADDVAEVNYNV